MNGYKVYLWLEGNVTRVYADEAGYNTVCAGIRTNDPVGTKYTNDQCENLNKQTWDDYQSFVRSKVLQPITDHELDAFTLLSINIGKQGFSGSTALRMFNQNNKELVPYHMQRWNKITENGVKRVSRVLTTRRSIESAIFVSALYAKKADVLLAQKAPSPVSPDVHGMKDLFSQVKRWKTTWGGIGTSGLGVLGMMSEKIHPWLLNGVLAGIFFLGFFFVFNRIRDYKIGEHL